MKKQKNRTPGLSFLTFLLVLADLVLLLYIGFYMYKRHVDPNVKLPFAVPEVLRGKDRTEEEEEPAVTVPKKKRSKSTGTSGEEDADRVDSKKTSEMHAEDAPIAPAAKEDAPAPAANETAPPAEPVKHERPTIADLFWYTEDVKYNGIPKDAEKLTSFSDVCGSWKGLIEYDPDDSAGARADSYFNADVTGTEDSAAFTLDWYYYYDCHSGVGYNEEDMTDDAAKGSWDNGKLTAVGAGCYHLECFYRLNGHVYAVGYLDTPDGIPAQLALVKE